MKRVLLSLISGALILVGCSTSGVPKAVTPVDSHDFGNVPVTNDMKAARLKRFEIKNEGTSNLKLSNLQVRLLEGC